MESSRVISAEVKFTMFDMLQRDLRHCLEKISEKAAMIESMDDLEEKREDEKFTLLSAIAEYDLIPYLISESQEDARQEVMCEISSQYYNRTNWIIRNSILKCY